MKLGDIFDNAVSSTKISSNYTKLLIEDEGGDPIISLTVYDVETLPVLFSNIKDVEVLAISVSNSILEVAVIRDEIIKVAE